MLTSHSKWTHVLTLSFAVRPNDWWSRLEIRALDFIMSYSASAGFSWVNHFLCVLYFPIRKMTFVKCYEVSGFPGQCSAMCYYRSKYALEHQLLDYCKWDVKDENINSWWIPYTTLHIQLWHPIEASRYKSVPRLYVWCWILATLTNKDLQHQQFHVKKRKYLLTSFSLSKCQTSQHVRCVSEVFAIALGQTSSFKSENWKFDCGGPFNICCSHWSAGSNETCLQIIFVVMVYF